MSGSAESEMGGGGKGRTTVIGYGRVGRDRAGEKEGECDRAPRACV